MMSPGADQPDPSWRLCHGYSPNLNIEHARQRWLFRMLHSNRPLPGSVYARVLDNWLGASSPPILGGDFRGSPPIV